MANETTQTKAALATAKGKAKTLADYLRGDGVMAKLQEVANETMRPEALVRMALMAQSRNPDLAKCDQASVLRALLDAAELRIMPGGLMGRGYLVPRKNRKTGTMECHFDPGWRGLVDIARRSKAIKGVSAHCVYEADTFSVAYGTRVELHHVPNFSGDRGSIIAAYAVAEYVAGGFQIEVVPRADLEKIRNTSPAGRNGNGPWNEWADEMCRKTAIRRLCKHLPFEPETEHAMRAALAADGDDDELVGDVVNAAAMAPARAARLTAKLNGDDALEPESAPDVDGSAAPVAHDGDGVVAETDAERAAKVERGEA